MRKKVVFVFDDGYKAEHALALDLFKAFNAKACSAVTSDFIGKTKEETGEPYSNLTELLELQRCGWEILSHGKTHKELSKLNIYEAEREISQSKKDLIKLGLNVQNFVYPCHSYNDNIKYLVSQNYKCARGKHGTDMSDKFALSGIMIDDHTQIEQYKQYIDYNNPCLIFYCHLCSSKIIASTLTDRMNTIQTLLEYIKDIRVVKTMTEVLDATSL